MINRSKKALKRVLLHPAISSRLKQFYFPQMPLASWDIAGALAQANCWLFTQTKSGTTLLCHTLAFYNAVRFEIPDVNFGSIERGGVGRKVGTDYTCLNGLLEFQRQHGQRVVVHTHGDLPLCKPPLLILTTRNPFDYAVSSYFYFYHNRHSKQKISVEGALPHIMARYCRTYHGQLAAAQRADKTIAIAYEHLVANPFETIGHCINHLYGSVNAGALTKAIQMASVDRLKSYERERGEAVIAREGTFAGEYFVRSGKVGEGAEFFSDDQRAIIHKYLTKSYVPMDGAL